MDLTDKDILQVDATVIVGSLVFLTITSALILPFQGAEAYNRLIKIGIAVSIIVPFSLSAIFVVCANLGRFSRYQALKDLRLDSSINFIFGGS